MTVCISMTQLTAADKLDCTGSWCLIDRQNNYSDSSQPKWRSTIITGPQNALNAKPLSERHQTVELPPHALTK